MPDEVRPAPAGPAEPTSPEPTSPEHSPDQHASSPQPAPGSGAATAPPLEPTVPTGEVASSKPHVASAARRRATMPWAIVGGSLVMLGAGAIGLTYTPVFHAKTITVSGEAHLSEARVLKIAGVGLGTDVFHLDVHAIERRLETDPWIADAIVVRDLPSALAVTISERTPVAVARSVQGTNVYLAADGRMLGPSRAGARLPEVRTAIGSSVPSVEETVAGAAIAEALPPGLRRRVDSIALSTAGATLQMRSGVTATYGDMAQLVAKGQALKAVIDFAAREGKVLVSVDVTVPGAPTATFVPGAATTP